MDRDVESGAFLEVVQRRAEIGDRLVGTVEGGAEDPDDADGVLVAQLRGRLRVQVETLTVHQDWRGSTSQNVQNFSQQTCTLTPITRLGRAVAG